MKFAIQVNSSPYADHSGFSAYQFVLAALRKDHRIVRVFFYKEGIYHAFKYASPPDDEWQMTRHWSRLAAQYDLDLVVCISAAQRRGLLCLDEAKRQGKQGDDVADGFRIGGLGQLVEAILIADRFVEFG